MTYFFPPGTGLRINESIIIFPIKRERGTAGLGNSLSRRTPWRDY
jgi:hypothetical protein